DPLLVEFLGYAHNEIKPEADLPAFDVPINRKQRGSTKSLKAFPDYVLSVLGHYVGICDAKGPQEDIDEHIDQLIAYVLALRGPSFTLVTNGTSLKLHAAWAVIFHAATIQDLDVRFDELKLLFS